MNLSDWLNAERGRAAAIAAHFGLTQPAVTHWRTKGVPKKHMVAVRDFTGGEVSLEEMLSQPPNLAGTAPEPEAAHG